MSAGRVLRLLAGALVLSSTSAVALGSPLAIAAGIAQSSGTNLGSFASYLLFTAIHTTPDAGAIWFTSDAHFDGPVHTNGEFRFFYQPTFSDRVSSVNSKAWFYNDGSPVELAADHNGSTDVPQFLGGFELGAPAIALPADIYAQQKVTLGLPYSYPDTAPTNVQIRNALGLTGTTAPPNDVYLVSHDGINVTGGIYVQGDLAQCLLRVDGDANQVYVLTQGASTDSIRVKRANNTTVHYSSAYPSGKAYAGLPNGCLFTNGEILDLRGPDRVGGVPPPALANGTQLLVIATWDIVVQRDITCANYETGNNVLGLFTAGGSVRIGTSAPNDMNLDAFVMATGVSGAFVVDNYDSGSPRGTFHLRGGSASKYYGSFYTYVGGGSLRTGYARDFHLDRRGVVPPYYPTVPVFYTGVPERLTPPAPVATLRLSLPRPNPSRGPMSVSYALPRAGAVRLTLFDVLGRRVARLVDAAQPAGEHIVSWDGARGAAGRVAPGIYLLLLEAAGERRHVRVVILR
jgi:hypothetical protein